MYTDLCTGLPLGFDTLGVSESPPIGSLRLSDGTLGIYDLPYRDRLAPFHASG
ncbi:hypothetical protein N9Z64_02385 [bacterium]|nr:hypothetical protein [bacterium]MDB4644891.1 hypothetical protein [Rubripirellula sp.]